MPAVKITNKPVSTPGDQTHFLVTQPEFPEGYTPTGQETEEELAELKVESVREIEMDDMVKLIQDKLDMDATPTTGSSKPVTSGGIKTALDAVDAEIGELKENLSQIVPGLSNDAKAALLACFRHVAFLDDDADYYGTLENALYATSYPKLIVSFLPGDRVFYTDEDISALTDYLTVRYYQDAEHSAETIAYGDYSLNGSLNQSVNTITVSYNGLSYNITVNSIAVRNITINDIASSVGYNNISVSDGTVEPGSVETFAVLTYNVSFIRFITPDARIRYVYRKDGDNYYSYDGTTVFLFTKNGNKYDVTNVTESEIQNIEKSGDPYAINRRTARLDTQTDVLTIIDNKGNSVVIRNANTIGYWGANNATGINHKFLNATTLAS